MGMVLLAIALGGCATPKIDWASRIGTYTYDQAVMDFGPPDKYAKLGDGTIVAEWLVYRGYVYSYYGGYGWWGGPWYGPYYPGYADSYYHPGRFLRLTFGPDSHLKAWKYFYK